MHKTTFYYRYLFIFGIPLLLILAMIVLASSTIFKENSTALSIGITLDLVFTVPLLYLLLIRRRAIPKSTVIVFFILGVVIASLIIPKTEQFYLSQIKHWVVPIMEGLVFFILISKIRRTIRHFRRQKQQTPDFYTAVQQVAKATFPKGLDRVFSSEIAVFYYSFFNWRKKKLGPREFSYHKNSGTPALLYAAIFIISIETVVVHLLLQEWNVTVAWIVSLLSMYTVFQIFGILRSLSKRPIVIEDDVLQLRYGFFSESTIPLASIVSISLSEKPMESAPLQRKLSPLKDLESHNVVIRVAEKNTLNGLYGVKKSYTTIAFYVDEKIRFEHELKKALQEHSCRDVSNS